MYPMWVILRHTFKEAVVQPIYTLLLAIGAATLVIFGALPFFTLGEDTVMFKAVSLDVVLVLVLLSTLFATSKSIFDEIEDRTMLTLMSKPVRKWQVLIGKYLGIILAAAVAIGIFGAIVCLCTWWRIPGDYQLNVSALDDRELKQIADYRWMNIAGLIPSFLLIWFQISVLAAIGRRDLDPLFAGREYADSDLDLHRGKFDPISVAAGERGGGDERGDCQRRRLRDECCLAVSRDVRLAAEDGLHPDRTGGDTICGRCAGGAARTNLGIRRNCRVVCDFLCDFRAVDRLADVPVSRAGWGGRVVAPAANRLTCADVMSIV